MTNWIISLLIVSLCISLTANHIYRLRISDLRRELADATDWMDPIVIGEPEDDDEF